MSVFNRHSLFYAYRICQGFYDSKGKPIPNLLHDIRNRQFTFFKPLKLEKLAIVQLQVAGTSQDLEIPYQINVLRASAYASAVVSVSDVLKNRLRGADFDHGNLPSHPQPLLTSKITFDLYPEDGVDKLARDMVDLRHAIQRQSSNT